MHTQARASLMLLVLCGTVSVAGAQDYCVICTGPDAKYRCSIGGEPSITAGSSRGQLLCITELARSGGHASCSVGRNTADPCAGEPRTVMFPASADPVVPVVEVQSDLPPAQGEPPAAPLAPAEAPPPPPEETQGSGSGNAVGNAVKKSWDCLSSLFSDC